MKMKLWLILCHATVVLSGMFLVFFCIDRVNPAMDFIGSEVSKWTLLLFVLVAMATAVFSIVQIRRRLRRRYAKREEGPAPEK